MTKRKCDLIYRIIIAIALEYLLFFSLESILPGLIVGVFNINILLVILVGLIVVLLFHKECSGEFLAKNIKSSTQKSDDNSWFGNLVMGSIVLFLTLIIVIILHKVSFWLIFVYLINIFIVSIILWFLP